MLWIFSIFLQIFVQIIPYLSQKHCLCLRIVLCCAWRMRWMMFMAIIIDAFRTLYNYRQFGFYTALFEFLIYWFFFQFTYFSKVPAFGNDFKKPIWYDEESDDELFDNNKLFGFQVFSDPMEIQKYHEQQLQQMLKTFEQMDGEYCSVSYLQWISLCLNAQILLFQIKIVYWCLEDTIKASYILLSPFCMDQSKEND